MTSDDPGHRLTNAKNLRAGTANTLATLASGNVSLEALGAAFLAPPLLSLLEAMADEIRNARLGRIAAVLTVASELRDEELEDLLVEAMASPERQQLLETCLEAGADAHTAEKIVGLGRALANGLVDDTAELEMSLLIVKALADLDAAHVRLLARLERDKDDGPQWVDEPLDRALRAVLERHALIEDDTVQRQDAAFRALAEHQEKRTTLAAVNPRQITGLVHQNPVPSNTMAGFGIPDLRPRWAITLFGSLCLDFMTFPPDESAAP